MRHRLLAIFFALPLIVCVLPGCTVIKDISSDPHFHRYQGDYKLNTVYVLKQDALIVDQKGWNFMQNEFFNQDVPRYFLESKEKRKKEDDPVGKVVGTMTAGTHLRFQQLTYYNYVEDSTIYPFAVTLDGQHAGMRTCLAPISYRDREFYGEYRDRYLHDPHWLEIVQNK
jgi:hypothetical protein